MGLIGAARAVSKNTLDWAVYAHKGIVWQTQSENSPTAIRAVIKQLQALPDFDRSNCVVCMEHTGLYNAHALDVFFQAQLPIWLEASLHIKQAGGLQRGNGAARRSDSVDAQRIAEYAYRFQDRTRLWKPARPVMKKLTEFTRLRQRLQGMVSQLKPGCRSSAFSRAKTIW
ncbi:IS110 family transposase [Spirosoma flavum]|uniref:IS110 family transposase n=1 Tax=Spirosoma flavum TaxID=2048557 RepID=UPI0036D36690